MKGDFEMSKRGGFPGGFGGGNINNLMKQAQKLQKDMEQAQKELEAKEFEASVGGGAVVVKVNGKKEVLAINIKEEVVENRNIVEMFKQLKYYFLDHPEEREKYEKAGDPAVG